MAAGLGTAGLVTIPAGSFPMGCDPAADSLCEPDESPVRDVSVAAFSIDRGEATQEGWRRCVEAGACTPPYAGPTAWEGDACVKRYAPRARGDEAIACVTWPQAAAFCAWQGKRLPTEEEWEKAARLAASREVELKEMGGGVGEWTASDFEAAPGFKVVRGFPVNGAHPETFDWRPANRFALAPRRLSHRIGLRCAATRTN